MTKKVRTILFLFLAILFLIVAPVTILYYLGWHFDWETKKIIQPGVFYFKIWPKNSQIYLNEEFEKKTDFFFGSALIENLSPKKYSIEIRKQGFHSWKKTLEIKEREVTEAKNIILISENPNFTIISKGIESFYFSPDNKKIILKEETNTNPENPQNPESSSLLANRSLGEGWALKLFDLEKNVKSLLIEEKDISLPARSSLGEGGEQVQLIDLKFSPDSKRILLEVGIISTPDVEELAPANSSFSEKNLGGPEAPRETSGVKIYYLLEIDKVPVVLTPLDFLGPDVQEVYFNPKNPQKLLILKTGKLSEADLTLLNPTKSERSNLTGLIDKKISSPHFENIITCSVLKNNIHCLDNSGFVFRTDFSFSPKEKLNTTPLPPKKETEYKIFGINSHIFLKESNILYSLNKAQKTFEKLFEPVKNLRFSPDSKKLVYFNNYEIWILFLEQIYNQPQREAGEKVFLTRFSEKINEIFWYTNHYLVFDVGDKIKIIEIDNRDKINIVDFAEFPSSKKGKPPKIFWNQTNKKLYILSEETLYSSKKLVP